MTLIKNCLGHIPLFILAIAFVTVCSFFSPLVYFLSPHKKVGSKKVLSASFPAVGLRAPDWA